MDKISSVSVFSKRTLVFTHNDVPPVLETQPKLSQNCFMFLPPPPQPPIPDPHWFLFSSSFCIVQLGVAKKGIISNKSSSKNHSAIKVFLRT